MRFQKRLRIKSFSYSGPYRYSVTIVCRGKSPAFKDKTVVEEILVILSDVSAGYGFSIVAYCFMPEHLHLLVEGQNENSDLKKFVSMAKQKTSHAYRKKTGDKLWQENYYEHVLRREEDTLRVVQYILENPVRRGLVKNCGDYPFCGSLTFDTAKI